MPPLLQLLLDLALGVAFLAAPIVVIATVAHYSGVIATNKVGRAYCDEHGYEFVGIQITKAHYILKLRRDGKLDRKKFHMMHLFGRVVGDVHWVT